MFIIGETEEAVRDCQPIVQKTGSLRVDRALGLRLRKRRREGIRGRATFRENESTAEKENAEMKSRRREFVGWETRK